MTVALDLPTRDRFDAILQPIVGNGDGTGVAAAARLLEGIDVPSLMSELTGRLDATLAGALPAGGPGDVTRDLLARFQTAVEAIPSDPAALMAPLTGRLHGIQARAAGDLSAELENGLSGLDELRSLVPVDVAPILAGVNPAVDAIKANLISGAFGRLRTWSEQVVPLAAEIEAAAQGGADSIQSRLIDWTARKTRDLVGALVPPAGTKAQRVVSALSTVTERDPATVIGGAVDSLEEALAGLRTRLEAGDFTAVAPFSETETRLAALVAALDELSGGVSAALDRAGDLAAIAADLGLQIEDIRDLEIVDLGSIRDGFESAISSVQAEVERIDLDAVAEAIRAPLGRLAVTVRELRLDGLRERVEGLGAQLDQLASGLEGGLLEVVTRVRTALADARAALRSIAESVGRFDPDGTYRFNVEAEIRSFLEGVRDALDQTVLPTIEEFRVRIGATLDEVRGALESVRGQIEDVRGELESALQGAADRIEGLNVEQRVSEIADRTRAMLDELGAIDFDVVIDPVIAEIGGMSDSLREIDASSLNEILRQALKLAVDVVIHIDFASDITDLLLAQLDEILEHPRRALGQVEATLEDSLADLARLAPAELLAPLDAVFAPVRERLDGLRLDSLAEPLESWHQSAIDELEKVSPAALLQPLVDLHRGLVETVDRVQPSALVEVVRGAIDDLMARLREIDVTGLAGDVGGGIAEARAAIERLSPDRLLAPASRAFSKIVDALDAFDPATLLEPFARLFEWIEAALSGLTDEHVRLLQSAIEPLLELNNRFDPEPVYATLREASARAHAALSSIEPGRLLADLQAAYRSLLAPVDPSVVPPAVADRLASLNPVRHEGLSRAIANLEEQKARLEHGLLRAQAPAELTAAYAEISDKLRSLVPTWADGEMTAESVKQAIKRANPVALEEEVRGLWDAVKDRVRAVDPARLAEPLTAVFAEAMATLEALDPGAVLEIGQGTIDRVIARVEAIDIGFMTSELDGATADVRAVVVALDPAPVIAQLDDIAAAVREAVARLEPRELLEDLEEPFEAAKALVEAFDPAALRAPLEAVFERVQEVIRAVDVGALLAPLVEKLDELRASLEAGLRRTETAFNGMLAAVPL